MIDPEFDDEPRSIWNRVSWIALPFGLLGLLGVAALAAHALADAPPPPRGWGVSHFGHLSRADDAQHGHERGARWGGDGAHARFAADWLLRGVGADSAQRDQIGGALEGALDDLKELGAQHHARRNEWLEALAAPSVDPEAIEALRRAELALADTASRRIADVVLEVANVLEPEQRAELLEALQSFHGRHGFHHGRRS